MEVDKLLTASLGRVAGGRTLVNTAVRTSVGRICSQLYVDHGNRRRRS